MLWLSSDFFREATLFLTIHSESCPVSERLWGHWGMECQVEDVSSLLVYMSDAWAGALLGTAPRGPVLEAHLGDLGDKKLAWQVAHCVLSGRSAVQPCSLGPSTGVTGALRPAPASGEGELGMFNAAHCCPPTVWLQRASRPFTQSWKEKWGTSQSLQVPVVKGWGGGEGRERRFWSWAGHGRSVPWTPWGWEAEGRRQRSGEWTSCTDPCGCGAAGSAWPRRAGKTG